MPARRSQDPSLTPAERAGDGALEHWDEERRRRAVPAPIERSLPDRDHGDPEEGPSARGSDGIEPRTCIDEERGDGPPEAPANTDQ